LDAARQKALILQFGAYPTEGHSATLKEDAPKELQAALDDLTCGACGIKPAKGDYEII
jgi:hypothetical protein